jgi:hypothetical protein
MNTEYNKQHKNAFEKNFLGCKVNITFASDEDTNAIDIAISHLLSFINTTTISEKISVS